MPPVVQSDPSIGGPNDIEEDIEGEESDDYEVEEVGTHTFSLRVAEKPHRMTKSMMTMMMTMRSTTRKQNRMEWANYPLPL
jgi:hypothetical protein